MTWSELEEQCGRCERCKLHGTRANVVFGVGARDARILFVGEGPGESEDLKGEPFVGKAGLLLDNMLKIIGLDRKENIYIANIVKCRPPGNRDPLPEEREACIGWLREQISLLKPEIIVCLGRIAAVTLIDEDFKITREHGKWYDIGGVKHMAIYHPAFLLRDRNRRPETFVDLKEIQRAMANKESMT